MNAKPTFRNRNTGYTYRPRTRRDIPRDVAYRALRRVETEGAYANLLLPEAITAAKLKRRDAAFVTELVYGTLRLRGRYDAIISLVSSRPCAEIDPEVLTILRLGVHQILGMRVEDYAAVDSAVGIARDRISRGPANLVNAVLRRIAAHPLAYWLDQIAEGLSPERAYAAVYSYPEWIVWALKDALVAAGRSAEDLPAILVAQNHGAYVTLCARPGLIDADTLATAAEEFLDTSTRLGELCDTAVVLEHGDPRRLRAVQRGLAGVQDEGSQLVAKVLAAVSLTGTERTWVDLCAGPGGKTALLAGLAPEGVSVVANEIAPHRAELVRQTTKVYGERVTVMTGDGREFAARYAGKADRVLVDAPCSGLGSLRRRPEARWNHEPGDLKTLIPLQKELLNSAVATARVGGVVAYSTCTPHLGETRQVLAALLAQHPELEVVDASDVARRILVDSTHDLGPGPYLQLWPDRDETDAMFLAILRKTA